jgi:hypothetical protein
MLRVNDRLRDVTGPLVRWMAVRGADRIPPILVDRMFLTLPLHAHLPEALIRLSSAEAQSASPPQVLILTELAGYENTDTLPENWTQSPVWVVVSGWGDPPIGPDSSGIEARARRLAEPIWGPPESLRVLHAEIGAAGKWAAVVEWRRSAGH